MRKARAIKTPFACLDSIDLVMKLLYDQPQAMTVRDRVNATAPAIRHLLRRGNTNISELWLHLEQSLVIKGDIVDPGWTKFILQYYDVVRTAERILNYDNGDITGNALSRAVNAVMKYAEQIEMTEHEIRAFHAPSECRDDAYAGMGRRIRLELQDHGFTPDEFEEAVVNRTSAKWSYKSGVGCGYGLID